ncbi:hypothetical protein P7K49_006940 [Saguinus oedipus]|uniref:BEACH domain-containing protein n=1 Tax=Saguinus oedipus TaxID=9490 RepID=A0ABQ9W3W4_SAGOE|nr:hypothetical protein P7K49_006940 [Saguinus oedipus]
MSVAGQEPQKATAVEAQIRSFGQTPSQLLIEPHPPRGSAMQVYLLLQSPLMFTDKAQQDVIMVLKFPSNSPVTHVAANTQPGLATPAVITVTANRLFAVNKWHNLPAHQGAVQDQPYQLPVEIDPLIASNTGMHRRQITDLLDQSIQVHSQCFVITSDNRYILVCGFWDKSFRVYSTDTAQSYRRSGGVNLNLRAITNIAEEGCQNRKNHILGEIATFSQGHVMQLFCYGTGMENAVGLEITQAMGNENVHQQPKHLYETVLKAFHDAAAEVRAFQMKEKNDYTIQPIDYSHINMRTEELMIYTLRLKLIHVVTLKEVPTVTKALKDTVRCVLCTAVHALELSCGKLDLK